MEKMSKQNRRKIVIYENKPRPAARSRSQTTCKRRMQKLTCVNTSVTVKNYYRCNFHSFSINQDLRETITSGT